MVTTSTEIKTRPMQRRIAERANTAAEYSDCGRNLNHFPHGWYVGVMAIISIGLITLCLIVMALTA